MGEKSKKVLILCASFYPGFRSGGPQQSVANIADVFGDISDIYILTQNHDHGTSVMYEGIETNVWMPFGKAKVKYISSEEFRYTGIKREYEKFDIIFSCGMFTTNTNALLLLQRFVRKRKKIYVAPMGVFSEGAFNSKKAKKLLFLCLCKIFKVFSEVTWSFSSEMELEDTKKVIGENYTKNYVIAEDIPRKVSFQINRQLMRSNDKVPDRLKIIFVSRICPKKNLDFCFDVLSKGFEGDIIFDIYGIIEDKKYWAFCEQKSERLSKNVHMRYCGNLLPEQVIPTMLKYDIFFFPTKGENYGHVIYEALCSGCVPIITDTTPWQKLDTLQAGNVIKYGDTDSFHNKISEYLKMEDCTFKIYKENAICYAEKKYENSIKQSGYRKIFCE